MLKYPHAIQYVTAEARVAADYQPAVGRREPHSTFLHVLVAGRQPSTCGAQDSIADAARRVLASRSEAIAIVDGEHRARGVLTADTLLAWVAAGGGDASQPVEHLLTHPPAAIAPDASVTDGVLALGTADVGVLAITTDGTRDGRLQALVTASDLATLFGEQPAALVRGMRLATSIDELRELNQRARAFTFDYLTGAASVEWLARLTHVVDVAILTRLLALSRAQEVWLLVRQRVDGPWRVTARDRPAIGDDRRRRQGSGGCATSVRARVQLDAPVRLSSTGGSVVRIGVPRLQPTGLAGTLPSVIRDPVRQQMYRARTLFDLRAIHGRRSLWQEVETAVRDAVDRDFVHVLANDCLASLPPLTFFQDAVVDSVGERHETFRLDHSALRPLVDVGRVFGMAAGQVLGRSTLERFAIARRLLPDHESIFREASDAFRVVLWQQGRVGISQGTDRLRSATGSPQSP